MNDKKIRVYVSTDKIGSTCETEFEVDADEWAGMTEEERQEQARDVMFEMIEWGYEDLP